MRTTHSISAGIPQNVYAWLTNVSPSWGPDTSLSLSVTILPQTIIKAYRPYNISHHKYVKIELVNYITLLVTGRIEDRPSVNAATAFLKVSASIERCRFEHQRWNLFVNKWQFKTKRPGYARSINVMEYKYSFDKMHLKMLYANHQSFWVLTVWECL